MIDAVRPGAPLLIAFSYVTWSRTPPFYLFGRSRKLEGIAGRKFTAFCCATAAFIGFCTAS